MISNTTEVPWNGEVTTSVVISSLEVCKQARILEKLRNNGESYTCANKQTSIIDDDSPIGEGSLLGPSRGGSSAAVGRQ